VDTVLYRLLHRRDSRHAVAVESGALDAEAALNSYLPKGCTATIPGLLILWLLTQRGAFTEIKKEHLNENSS
jgi:hypothetical protein